MNKPSATVNFLNFVHRINSRKMSVGLIPFFLTPLAHADGIQWIDSGKDVQLYIKPKYDLFHTFDQEFGIQACIAKYGNLREQLSACYDPTYPIRFNTIPRFSVSEQTCYILSPKGIQPAVYTKFKNNLIGTWKQESGLSAKLYGSPVVNVCTCLGYCYNLPFKSSAKPQFVSSLMISFPLGR